VADTDDVVLGTVEGPCPEPKCKGTIPANSLTCPVCGYKRKFNQKQYERLCRDISEWNKPRRGHLFKPNVHLEGADLRGAHLKDAHLELAHLEGAHFIESHLERAHLQNAHLEGAHFIMSYLEHAHLERAHLEGTSFSHSHLQDVDARYASINGGTVIMACCVDTETDFTAVGLASARVEPKTRAHLEYNIRCFGWLDWYENRSRWWTWTVKLFWWVSDYGRSTARILVSIAAISLVFAAVYWGMGFFCSPGAVTNLFEVEGELVPHLLVPLRAIYFSVVTMTTLGFGDMYANAHSFWGHFLLTLQVFLGYILLGALITRFAIMFTGVTVPWDRPKHKKSRLAAGLRGFLRQITWPPNGPPDRHDEAD